MKALIWPFVGLIIVCLLLFVLLMFERLSWLAKIIFYCDYLIIFGACAYYGHIY